MEKTGYPVSEVTVIIRLFSYFLCLQLRAGSPMPFPAMLQTSHVYGLLDSCGCPQMEGRIDAFIKGVKSLRSL